MTIAIIGGGAAGLMAAITAANQGAEVTVFEQNSEPGKKILASGNGHCNIINRDSGIEDFDGENTRFATYALHTMDFHAFETFCKSIGLLLETKADGKCYPFSQEARAVQSALLRAALHHGTKIVNNAVVTDIAQCNHGFSIKTAETEARFDRVIIATGTPAAPQLGGCDSGLVFARSLGHSVVDPFPALVGLHLDAPDLSKIFGVKTVAHVTLTIDGTAVKEVEGDVLFTRYGISGFAILDLSYTASRALRDYADVSLKIDLLPSFTAQSLAAQIDKMAKAIPDDTLYDLLCALLPHKLVRSLLRKHGIDTQSGCRELNPKTAKRIAFALKQWTCHVSDTHGYKHAEVAGGGISTEEINPQTMESLRVPSLFFAGEVIDITGHRGGFNFHFAWGSGFLAGMNAAKQ